MNVAIVIILFRTLGWTRRLLPQLREQLPEIPFVFVDNNNDPAEAEYAAKFGQVLPGGEKKTHGTGIDRAVDYCRNNGYFTMIHIEPDCEISGRDWFENLHAAIAAGNLLASGHRKPYGPLHPTPSAWDLSFDWDSFDVCDRSHDQQLPEFAQLFDLDTLAAEILDRPAHIKTFWAEKWDTAQKNWFRAARLNRAALIDAPDFTHHWFGHKRRPPASVAIITPTLGRPTLKRTIASGIDQLGRYDEWFIIGDGRQRDASFQVAELVDRRFHYLETTDPASRYGNAQRNAGIKEATADYLVWLDDDDELAPDALQAIRKADAELPSPRPLMFQMDYQRSGPPVILPRTHELIRGNVAGPMFVVPNLPGRVAQWNGSGHATDFDFIQSTLKLWPDDALLWCEGVVCKTTTIGGGLK